MQVWRSVAVFLSGEKLTVCFRTLCVHCAVCTSVLGKEGLIWRRWADGTAGIKYNMYMILCSSQTQWSSVTWSSWPYVMIISRNLRNCSLPTPPSFLTPLLHLPVLHRWCPMCRLTSERITGTTLEFWISEIVDFHFEHVYKVDFKYLPPFRSWTNILDSWICAFCNTYYKNSTVSVWQSEEMSREGVLENPHYFLQSTFAKIKFNLHLYKCYICSIYFVDLIETLF